VRRHPGKTFVAGDASLLPFRADSFDAAFSFHVLMHLDPAAIAMVLAEVGRVLKPDAIFVADVASGFRRRLHPRPRSQWHGATGLTSTELARLAAPAGLKLRATAGIALIPVHRVPGRFRRFLTGLDRRLAALAPDWASYIVGCFAKELSR
jgi:SAM-dependent methyltransferase